MPSGLKPPYSPMEAISVTSIPEGHCWEYEPKWDGLRSPGCRGPVRSLHRGQVPARRQVCEVEAGERRWSMPDGPGPDVRHFGGAGQEKTVGSGSILRG